MNEAQAANAAFGIPEALVKDPTEELDAFGFRKKYFEITVYPGPRGSESIVKVGVNGRAFLLKRGERVIVPSVVTNALDHAVQEVTVSGDGGLVTRPEHRFPYQVHREASEADYIAYQARGRKEREARALQAQA